MTTHPLIAKGELAERNGDYLAATAAYSAAALDSDPSVAGDASFHLGRVSWRQGRYDDALSRYDKARSLGEQASDVDLCARAENGIGAIHYARGEYAQARASYHLAYERSGDEVLRGKVLLNLGVIANIEGRYHDAREHYKQSRHLLSHARDDGTLALVLHNLGMLHADLEEWDEAGESYRRCLEISEANGDRQMVANVLLNRSELLCGTGRYAEAIVHCERAMMIYAELGDILGRGEALRWQGSAYRRSGDGVRATRVLSESARIARQLKAELLRAEVSREVGLLRAEGADIAHARKSLSEALECFSRLGAVREVEAVKRELESLRER